MCNVSQADLASREGASDPQQVQSLEGHQNEADVGSQVLGTFRVHEMVGGVAAHVLFIAHSGCQVYSAKIPYKQKTEAVLAQAHTCKTRLLLKLAQKFYSSAILHFHPTGLFSNEQNRPHLS